MMGTQNLVVSLLVAASGVYLIYLAWGVVFSKRTGGCGTCSSCSPDDAAEKRLVTLDPHVDDLQKS